MPHHPGVDHDDYTLPPIPEVLRQSPHDHAEGRKLLQPYVLLGRKAPMYDRLKLQASNHLAEHLITHLRLLQRLILLIVGEETRLGTPPRHPRPEPGELQVRWLSKDRGAD